MPEGLLLDTCALVWLATGHRSLSTAAREEIDRAPFAYVSAISAWEVSMKALQGDLELPMEPEEWFGEVMIQHSLTLLDLSPEILMAANRLPWHHRDSADRFILATALDLKVPIVTLDKRFTAYGVRVLC